MFPSLVDELVVDEVYLRVLVRDAQDLRGSGREGELAGAGSGLGQGLELPGDLLVSRGCGTRFLVVSVMRIVTTRPLGGGVS